MNQKHDLIPSHGGYRKLRSFQTAQLVYDATVIFCDRFIEKYSRTRDQMIQAARSGVQNIAEGSMASATSKKIELKLTGIARASLEELLLDYEDFLRQHGLKMWDKDSPESLAVRRKYQSDRSDQLDPYSIKRASAEVAANTLFCLINQARYLLKNSCRNWKNPFFLTVALQSGYIVSDKKESGPTGRTSLTGLTNKEREKWILDIVRRYYQRYQELLL